jgi:predicted alpha/beta-fold hydrolase
MHHVLGGTYSLSVNLLGSTNPYNVTVTGHVVDLDTTLYGRWFKLLPPVLRAKFQQSDLAQAHETIEKMAQFLEVDAQDHLRKFDDLYTSRASGFKDSTHYYQSCSAVNHLSKIEVPTVLLTAKDDPFVPVSDYLEAKLSRTVHLHAEETGGHMGYLTRSPTGWGSRRWLDYAITEYLNVFFSRPS